MAIVKMKRLRAITMASQRDELLKEMMLLGCVELTTQSDVLSDPEAAALVTPDHGALMESQAERQKYKEAIGVLNQHVPQKKKLLSAKPEISATVLLDETGAEALSETADEINSLSERLKTLASEETREKLLIETLTPWKDCALPLDHPGTRHVAATFGMLPATADMDAISAALQGEVGAAELYETAVDESARYIYVIHLRDDADTILKLLRERGFTAPACGETAGAASDGIKAAEAHLKEIEAEREKVLARIEALAPERDALKRCADRAETKVDRAEAAGKLLKMQNVLLLEGWAVADKEAEITALLKKFGCAYEFTEPAEEEYDDVPVKLRNNKVTDGLNMVTSMYSLPRYGTVDPNPLMAPFFILFYGIMMADMGYGILMVIAALVAMKKMKPRSGTLSFCRLLLWGGISTFIWGALTAGFFSDAPEQIARILNPNSTFTWFWKPLFTPLNDSIFVLGGAIVLGFIHMNFGLVVSFVEKVKHGDTLGAILYEGALWVLAVGLILWLGGAMLLDNAALGQAGLNILIVGGVALLAGGMRGKKGFGIITSVFSTLYNELTGWFGDLLSYSRIMALMLAGSVIGTVFNTIGAMFGNIILFLIIFLIGHALNFGLNLLGCYVHDLRLQCLEFFGKFYVDGGREFDPLKVRTEYVNISE